MRVGRRVNGGFTIVELMLVIPIVAILSVYASAAVTSAVSSFRLSAASARIVHDIRYAAQQAMSHGTWYGISFSMDPANQYHVYQTDGISDTDVQDPANRGGVKAVNVKSEEGVVISAVNLGGGSKVEFDLLGRPYDDKNGAALAEDGSISISCGEMTKTIQIFKVTGSVEMASN